ncbi:MAG: zinc dependent phospholipase C family protein [Halanaerobium sp.]
MPDFWTHIIAGNEIKNRIKDDNLKKIINDNQKLFNLACQGPDPFFYNQFWPWIKNKEGPPQADLIHHSSGEVIFRNLLIYYKYRDILDENEIPASEKKEKLLVYLLGFAAHFAVDSVCHPFVIENCGSESNHKLFEMKLDKYMVETKFNKNVIKLDPLKYIDIKEGIEEIVEFYIFLYPKLSQEKISDELIKNAYKDFKTFLKIFYDPKKLKYFLFVIIDKFIEHDIASYNFYLAEKCDYWDENIEEFYKEFDTLYYFSINKGISLFENIMAYLSGDITLESAVSDFIKTDFLGKK